MAKSPSAVEIRSYQVGFGDCFLVTFVYSKTDRRHVLIDFGSTHMPKGLERGSQFTTIARAIEAQVGPGGRLTALVATHRHADHINGFATTKAKSSSGMIIRGLRPRLVLQPWTEDPAAARDAKRATRGAGGSGKQFVAALASMHSLAKRIEDLATNKAIRATAAVRKELRVLGADNLTNKSAVDNLIAMGRGTGSRARYLRYGDDAGLSKLLPGVKVHVLGPPDLTQSDAISSMASRDAGEFWQLVRGAAFNANAMPTDGARAAVPNEARWFRDHLDRLPAHGLLEIVRSLDKQMNNTSLILLFEVFGKKLLFPGDAQLENWSYALESAPDSAKVRTMLAGVDFYKVGHHGSLNATPKQMLWGNFKKTRQRQLRTMLSTMSDVHGHTSSRTEVPRRTLVDELHSKSRLMSTDGLPAGQLENLVTIKR